MLIFSEKSVILTQIYIPGSTSKFSCTGLPQRGNINSIAPKALSGLC